MSQHEALPVGSPEHNAVLLRAVREALAAGRTPEEIEEGLRHALPTQGGVTTEARVREAVLIVERWPEEYVDLAMLYATDWHALLEPARWVKNGEADFDEVKAFALGLAERKARWPRTDELRRRFGKTSGHRLAGEDASQEVLGV